ncbi:hypothetical protein IWW36_003973 [Coemansia brasiliensis]|uniref:Sodium/calcium exchanger membrane region domain-containing protein n=1 Tax=Coemansia brasiliensis TaxID=2650707 RepID=A0A9W8I472_9FUNG|nr:hypothetical protein IWW36_003973 [Coemansia brasiliensis]
MHATGSCSGSKEKIPHTSIEISAKCVEDPPKPHWQYEIEDYDEFDTAGGTVANSSRESTWNPQTHPSFLHRRFGNTGIRARLHGLKSFSHDGAIKRSPINSASTSHLAVRPTTQCNRSYNWQHESIDSPDMLNSRQLRRQVARHVDTSSSCSQSCVSSRQSQVSDGEPNVSREGGYEEPTALQSLQNAACVSWFNLLLVFVPLGYLAHYLKWPVLATFILNYLAIIPLSALMGFATEEVSLRLGPTWGGVVNAMFGNVVELIVAVIALIEEEYRIVQAGLIGSVLSNTLLVLGCAFLAGGFHHRVQLFHAEAAQCAGSLLALSVLSMIIPAAYHGVHASGGEITNGILVMSRGTALILLLVYVLFLVFQLKTHSDLFNGLHASHTEEKSSKRGTYGLQNDADGCLRPTPTLTDDNNGTIVCCCTESREIIRAEHERNECQEHMHDLPHSGPQMKLWIAAVLLVLISVLVAMSSDILVDSVEELTKHYAITHTFVGMVLLPIAASASEHAMSVVVAVRDKMDVCITVAVGTSMQMTLFVLPVLIIIAWIMNRPLTLFFDDFETTTMLISVLVINYLIMNGRSNWLKGAMLLSSYFIVVLAFFLYPNDVVDDP